MSFVLFFSAIEYIYFVWSALETVALNLFVSVWSWDACVNAVCASVITTNVRPEQKTSKNRARSWFWRQFVLLLFQYDIVITQMCNALWTSHSSVSMSKMSFYVSLHTSTILSNSILSACQRINTSKCIKSNTHTHIQSNQRNETCEQAAEWVSESTR